MSQRAFDHLYTEICVAVGARISRYALWLLVWESGADPDDLKQDEAGNLVELHLPTLLREEGFELAARARKRLARKVQRFDSRYPTPEEWLIH